MSNDSYFQTRFTPDPRRSELWRTLYKYYFSSFIRESDCVLELGAGYGAFINNVVARRRIALDSWEGFLPYLNPDVEGHVGDVCNLSFLTPASVNFVLASNLFEHITQDELAGVLSQLKKALAADGTLNIVQPNYYYCYREYFDDYTHKTVYTHTSLCNFLEAHGYRIIECRPRFLPLTLKSRLPVSPLLVRAYLLSPWKPMARQMLIRAAV